MTASAATILQTVGTDCGAAEFHGLVVAEAAVHPAKESVSNRWLADQLGIPESEVNAALIALAQDRYKAARESLEEFSDFDLRLELPEDAAAIDDRFSELTCWCSGFLRGLALAESARVLIGQPEHQEMLSDLAAIAGMMAPVPDSEANEGDFIEIVEYVRIVVLTLATEARQR